MVNVQQNIAVSKKDVPNLIAGMDSDDRKTWVNTIRTALIKNDLQTIKEAVSKEYPSINIDNVKSVLVGRSYNPNFGPLVIRAAIEIISTRKDKRVKTKFEAQNFVESLIS